MVQYIKTKDGEGNEHFFKIKDTVKLTFWKSYSTCLKTYGLLTREKINKYDERENNLSFVYVREIFRCKKCGFLFPANFHNLPFCEHESNESIFQIIFEFHICRVNNFGDTLNISYEDGIITTKDNEYKMMVNMFKDFIEKEKFNNFIKF